MIAYILLVEHWECAATGEEACSYARMCTPDKNHPRRTEWRPWKTISTTLGPQHAHLSRIAREAAKYGTQHGRTGAAEIFKVELSTLSPVWGDEERAAYRIGGLESVHKITKAKAAAERKLERQAQRDAARAAKAKGDREIRPKRKGKATHDDPTG